MNTSIDTTREPLKNPDKATGSKPALAARRDSSVSNKHGAALRQFLSGALLLVAFALGSTAWANDQKTWTVNFNDTDIQEVIRFVADATGRTIIIDPKVRGQIKVISRDPVNSTELYELFLSILDIHGYTAIESGRVTRIVPNRDARSLSIPTSGLEATPPPIDDTYVTQVIRLENISAAKVLPTLRPLVPQHGHLAAYDPANALIITDTRANIVRIVELAKQLDRTTQAETELVQLRYARAGDVVNLMNQLERSEARDAGQKVVLVADERINGILIHGEEMQRRRVKALIDRIDLPQASDSNVRVVYLKYAKAESVAQILSGVIQNLARMMPREGAAANGEPSVQADPDTNALLITADSDTMQSLLSVIDSLDIRRAQVLVEAIIVEISDRDARELGINWMYRDADYGFGSSNAGNANLGALALHASRGTDGLRDLVGGLAQTSGQVFGFGGRLNDRTDLFGILRLLQQSSATNILSTPTLLTTDNHTASISVGQNVPFQTGSFPTPGSTAQPSNIFRTVERRDVGILLEVTPHVNEGNSVILDISQEVSSVDASTPDGITTNQRRIETQVLAADGEVVVLGGLIQDDVQTSDTQVPLLGNLPVLGHLFRSQTSTTVKTNLMVFIRASVIRDDQMLTGATAEKYSAIRDDQLERQRHAGILVNSRNLPVIPEWNYQPLPEDPQDDGDAQSD